MSEKTIYQTLRDGGLSPAGACAMIGNMDAESSLISIRKQGDFSENFVKSQEYTAAVNSEEITRWQFMSDSIGYGLCQWTLSTRKDHLYMFAREAGTSIGDELMQCRFCLWELQNEYADDLYPFLCQTDDLAKATQRICAEFERPAVNNFADRINAAKAYFNKLVGASEYMGCGEDSCPVDLPFAPVEPIGQAAGKGAAIPVRVLKQGDLGRDVFLLQCGLQDMGINCGLPDGDFGLNTKEAVMTLQRDKGLNPTGIADSSVWEIILTVR